MSQINFDQMSDRELKAYFLAHRNEKEAFEAYMDRLQEKPQQVIIGATEIDNLTVAEQIQIITDLLTQPPTNPISNSQQDNQ